MAAFYRKIFIVNKLHNLSFTTGLIRMCICLFSYVRILNRGLAKAAGPSVAGSQSTADRPPQEPSMARAPSLRQAPLPFTHYSLQGGSDTSASTTIAQIEAAQAQSAQAALDRMKAAAAVAAAAKALKQDAESAPAAQSQGPLTEAVLLLHLQRTAPAPAPACWRPPAPLAAPPDAAPLREGHDPGPSGLPARAPAPTPREGFGRVDEAGACRELSV